MDTWRSTLGIYNDPWPADTERRRVGCLKDFVQTYPAYLATMTKAEREDLLAQAHTQYADVGTSRNYHGTFTDGTGKTDVFDWNSEGNVGFGLFDCGPYQQNYGRDKQMVVRRMKTPRHSNENKWDLLTTLELLESMKAYVTRHEVSCVGVAIDKWTEIAVSLENPRGIELKKFARSCQVRYDNIRRYLNAGQDDRIDEHIRSSVVEYLQICQRNAAVEKHRPRVQARAHNHRRQTRYTYSKEVSRMDKINALSRGVGRSTQIPREWSTYPGGHGNDDKHFSSLLVPSEFWEEMGSGDGARWEEKLDGDGLSRGKQTIMDDGSRRNSGFGCEFGDGFHPNLDFVMDSIALHGERPSRAKQRMLNERGQQNHPGAHDISRDDFDPKLESVIENMMSRYRAEVDPNLESVIENIVSSTMFTQQEPWPSS